MQSDLRRTLTKPWSDAERQQMLTWRRHLHQHPELGGQEKCTQRWLREELKALDCRELRASGGTGLVGLIGSAPGKCLLIRADIDGLPIQDNPRFVVDERALPIAGSILLRAVADYFDD